MCLYTCKHTYTLIHAHIHFNLIIKKPMMEKQILIIYYPYCKLSGYNELF